MNFFSSSHYPVNSSTVLGGDRVTENALHSVSIKQCHGWNGELHCQPLVLVSNVNNKRLPRHPFDVHLCSP